MDCEKFDRIVLDLLYDELDELTAAAAKRHMDHCARCRDIGAGLRATREVGVLPLVDAPEGLELRILEAEQSATRALPMGKRLARGLSLVAGYAMRPQVSMAALLMLMIGSSLLFLRAQPGDREHVLVTERGVPESDTDQVAVVAKKADAPSPIAPPSDPGRSGLRAVAASPSPSPTSLRLNEEPARRAEAKSAGRAMNDAPAAPALGAGPSANQFAGDDKASESTAQPIDGEASYDGAMAAYRDGRYSEAQRRFSEIAGQGGSQAASAALYEVQAMRMVSGCPTAAPRFEGLRSRYPSVASDAAWQAADCYRSLGESARARATYEQLINDPSYKGRAKEAIAELDHASEEVAARKSKAAAAPAAAAPAKPATPTEK